MRRASFALFLFGLGFAAANHTLSGQVRQAQTDSYRQQNHAAPSRTNDPPFHPSIPQAWDEGTIANLQLPLADPRRSPVEVPWEYYYRIPRRLIYKSYAIYAPGREPAGYFD